MSIIMNKIDIKLISKISHEVMSPVISSRWALEIMLADKNLGLDDTKKAYLLNIYNNLNRISTISNKLINYARFSVGELIPVKSKVNIEKSLSKLEDSFSKEYKDIKITKNVNDVLGFIVEADQSMFDFVLQSLIHNAVVYSSEKGDITVVVSGDKSVISFEVRDNGIGIPDVEQKSIFDEFSRASNADAIYAKGIGLALFLSKKICEVSDWKISFKSEENKGSSFFVSIPRNV